MSSERECQSQAQRIVIKVGSSTLTREGKLRPRKFSELARSVSQLMDQGREVVLVSSGAIAAGSHRLGWTHSDHSIPEKQAAAAVGQIGLVDIYQRRFSRHGKQVGQVLLTRDGLHDRERFLNARHTLLELLRVGAVPIVNENDTVSTEEIRFGDNDNLSATIVNLIGADLLIIVTDVDGLYTEPPTPGRRRPKMYEVVDQITPEIEAAAAGPGSSYGRGGMVTKLEAARMAARSGAATVLCNGRQAGTIEQVAQGANVGTLFLPGQRMASRKHWLAFTTHTKGILILDAGAARALTSQGGSLLPAGIVRVEGDFGVGDPVLCTGPNGESLARGLSAYSSGDIDRIRGIAAKEIGEVLGYSNGSEVIHRDDLVILDD
ncbi:MAG: glutamate 5-kinase [Myxococcota bacterium]|jgi:glutamate 5-kinase|nr:glutamate 5-kinase [Myxococcota bacterium]